MSENHKEAFTRYTLQIKGLKRIIEDTDAKKLWVYVVDHYDKLDNKGMKDKLDNFNTIVLDYLYKHISGFIYSEEAENKIHNITMLNYSVEQVSSECAVALKETILEELRRLPSYVSEQVIVKLLVHLKELNIGLRFSQKEERYIEQ